MSHFRWIVFFLGMCGVMIAYFDRSLMAYAIGPVEAEFGLTDIQFGILLSAFAVGYLVTTFIGGMVCDKYGVRWTLGAAGLCWSLVAISTSWAQTYNALIIFLAALGLTEGFIFLSVMRMAGNWFPEKTRMTSITLMIAMVPLACIFISLIMPPIIMFFGWRDCYLILGGCGLVWATLWLIFTTDYPQHSRFVNDAELTYIAGGKSVDRAVPGADLRYEEAHAYALQGGILHYLFTNRSVITNYVAAFAYGYVLFFVLMWLPGYFQQTYPKATHHTLQVVLPWIVALVVMICSGFTSDYIRNRYKSLFLGRTLLFATALILSGIITYFASGRLSEIAAVIVIAIGTGIANGTGTISYALNIELAPGRTATATGFWDASFSIAGIIAPWVTGLIATDEHSFSWAFTLLSFILVAAGLFLFLFQRPAPVEFYEEWR